MLAVAYTDLLPYRQLEGFTKALTRHIDGPKTTDYTSIHLKVPRMNFTIGPSIKCAGR